jgi:hypothetical protein
MSLRSYRFVFIVGASGSGTTMLARLLSSPPGCVGLGGNHVSIPKSDSEAYGLARRFRKANDQLWDRTATATRADRGRRGMLELIDRLLDMPGYGDVTHVIFKRSAPFHRGDRYRPDLADLVEMFPDLRVVVVHRDPRASTASSHRRRFAPNLRACAVLTEEQLTYLSSQLCTLDPAIYLSFAYEDFCERPVEWMGRIAVFCGLPREPLEEAVRAERVDPGRNEAWQRRLSPEERDFLNRFFDQRRARQWPLLAEPHVPTAAGMG